jgi:hypothetical protein
VGDRFLLLKRGKSIGYYEKKDITLEELTAQMAGGAELAELAHELEQLGGHTEALNEVQGRSSRSRPTLHPKATPSATERRSQISERFTTLDGATMEMLIAGNWRNAADGRTEEVRSPFDGRTIDTVPVATAKDAQDALDRAEIGAHLQRTTPAHERVDILLRAAALADERAEDIAQTISAETGKPITEARGEASAAPATSSAWPPMREASSTAPPFRWTPTPEPGWTRSASRCGSRWGSSSPSRRSTTPPCWCCTRLHRRWQPVTPSCLSLPGQRR